MNRCLDCPYAEWDYEEFYNTKERQWFVDGCSLDKTPEECEENAE